MSALKIVDENVKMAIPLQVKGGMMEASDSAASHAVSGYPKELFQGSIDPKFVCNFCIGILRDPVQSFCGHRFCRACIEGVVSSGDQRRCLICEKDGELGDYSLLKEDQMFPDNAVKREMASLQAVCPNSGCTWTGTFKEYEAKRHFDECVHQPVACQSCGQLLSRSLMQEHMERNCPNRTIMCKFCRTNVVHKELEIHSTLCPKHPLKCEGCGRKKIPRDQMQQHMDSECPNQKVQCPAGCGLVPRNEILPHFSKNAPLHIGWIMEQLVVHRSDLDHLATSGTTNEVITQQINDANDNLAALERQFTDFVNAMPNQQQQQQLAVLDSDTRQYMDLALRPLKDKCSAVEIKANAFEGIASALHRELETVITHLERMETEKRTLVERVEANERKIRTLERTLALKDIALTEFEFRVSSMENASYDGTLVWKIPDFRQKQRDAMNGKSISIYSPAFFTNRRGYKMCARLYPNGDGMGKGSHLSLFFVIMRGQYDAILKWPFEQRVTFCLINQSVGGDHVIDSFRPDPTSSSFRRPTTDMNIASGCPMFTRLDKFQHPSNDYLKDDTMFVKVDVDVKGVLEPLHNVP